MLVLKRKNNFWTEIKVNKAKLNDMVSGKAKSELRFRVYNIARDSERNLRHQLEGFTRQLKATHPEISRELSEIAYNTARGESRVDIAFDDPDNNFEIQRPERLAKLSDGLL